MSADVDVQLFIDGDWVSVPVYAAEGWTAQIGPDLQAGAEPSTIGVTLANDDLSLDPSNVAGPLYGKIGPNTPTRLMVEGDVVTVAEASSWRPEATIDHVPGAGRGRAWVGLQADGLLRRLRRWTEPIRSPMTRQVLSYSSLIGFWPLEDPPGAASLAQLGPTSALAGTFSGPVSLGGGDPAGGTADLVQLAADTSINGRFGPTTGNGWQVSFVAKLAAVPGSGTYLTFMSIFDGAGRAWYLQVNNGAFNVRVEDSDGVLIHDGAATFGAASPDRHVRYRLRVTVSGSTVTWNLAWYEQDAAAILSYGGSFSSSVAPAPVRWRVASTSYTEGAAYGQVFAVTDTALNLVNGYGPVGSFNGYLGESMADRILRLCGEEGIEASVLGDAERSPVLGRQRAGVFLALLEEAVRTDGGLLYDDPADVALVVRLRNHIAAAGVVLQLERDGDVAYPLTKVIDDVGAENDITVTNWDGTEARVELATGRLSTLPPPAGVGRYKGTLDVSFADPGELEQRGNLQLRAGTVDRPRYQAVTIDLLASPGLREDVVGLDPGDLIRLVGAEPDPLVLMVLRVARAGGDTTERATLACVPGDVYLTGAYDSTEVRYDARTTTLSAGVSSSATTLVFRSTDRGDVWSSTSAFDVIVAGERIGVPAGGVAAQAGTGPWTQTVTGVTRSKNGVVKAQSAGAEVHVADPARWL